MLGDPAVGSVQVQIQMLNRHDRWPLPRRGRLVNALGRALVRLRDLESRVPVSAVQIARRFTGSVGLGGNGQFSRLSALRAVAGEDGPWRGALPGDYELGLRLMMTGHRNEYTRDTWVEQEARPDIRGLLRQRTRWSQGTMQSGACLRRLWTSPHVTKSAALEASCYLIQPWVQLIGTFVYPVPGIVFVASYLAGPAAMPGWAAVGGRAVLAFYLAAVGPFVLWGRLYLRRCEPWLGLAGSLVLGAGYSLFAIISHVASWRAFSAFSAVAQTGPRRDLIRSSPLIPGYLVSGR